MAKNEADDESHQLIAVTHFSYIFDFDGTGMLTACSFGGPEFWPVVVNAAVRFNILKWSRPDCVFKIKTPSSLE